MNLDELRRLHKAATPAPWAVATDRQGDYLVAHHEAAVCDLLDSTLAARQDARLIAAARNALPALLRVAEAARRLAAGPESTAWDELYAALAALDAPREH